MICAFVLATGVVLELSVFVSDVDESDSWDIMEDDEAKVDGRQGRRSLSSMLLSVLRLSMGPAEGFHFRSLSEVMRGTTVSKPSREEDRDGHERDESGGGRRKFWLLR